jgi:protein-disulfide isomerase
MPHLISARLLLAGGLATASFACARSEATPIRAGVTATAGSAASASTAGTTSGLTDSVSTAADRGRIRGAAAASVWLIEVSDFQCPYCKMWHDDSYAALDREYVQPGKVRLAYLNYPLEMHRNARAAAEAAMCGAVQGRFWELHESLFATQKTWEAQSDPMPTFDSLAVAAGAQPAAWRSCMSTHATAKLIDADRDRSARAGVQSTPTFFVGDRKIEGAYPVDSFRVALDAALARQGAKR